MCLFGNRWSRSGFSLTELLVAVAAMGIIMAALAPFLSNFLRHVNSGSVYGMILQEGRWAIDFMDRDISYASAGTVNKSVATGVSSNVVSYSLPGATDVISFSIVSGEVCRQSTASSPWRPLTDAGRANVSSLSFVRNFDRSVSVTLVLTATDRFGRSHSREFKSFVYPMSL